MSRLLGLRLARSGSALLLTAAARSAHRARRTWHDLAWDHGSVVSLAGSLVVNMLLVVVMFRLLTAVATVLLVVIFVPSFGLRYRLDQQGLLPEEGVDDATIRASGPR